MLQDARLVVAGGDEREMVLIPELVRLGARVSVCGFSPSVDLGGGMIVPDLQEALQGSEALILPMPGTDDQGVIRAIYASKKLILTREALRELPQGAPVFIGNAKPYLRNLLAKLRLRLIEYGEDDEIAILNAIPTVEGAIQMAIQETPFTIHGSNSWVLGLGRVGMTLTRVLSGLGARTTVVARKPRDLARAVEMGCQAIAFENLEAEISTADLVFNTVPALVLNVVVLSRLQKSSLIIDLASAPGGTDFNAAKSLGVKAILAPGLPGKVAPLTAGLILARSLPPLIAHELGPRT